MLFDNLGELRTQYEATLSEYRAKRTHVVNALIMLSFFGGLALALLGDHVGPAANRLGQPALVADRRGNGLLRGRHGRVERTQPNEANRSRGSRVRSLPAPPAAGAKEQDHRESSVAGPMPADSKLRSLAEKVDKAEGGAEELKSDRFVVRQYALPHMARSAMGENSDKPLAWYPLVTAGADGRVTFLASRRLPARRFG